jgi:hypothetical protein
MTSPTNWHITQDAINDDALMPCAIILFARRGYDGGTLGRGVTLRAPTCQE